MIAGPELPLQESFQTKLSGVFEVELLVPQSTRTEYVHFLSKDDCEKQFHPPVKTTAPAKHAFRNWHPFKVTTFRYLYPHGCTGLGFHFPYPIHSLSLFSANNAALTTKRC